MRLSSPRPSLSWVSLLTLSLLTLSLPLLLAAACAKSPPDVRGVEPPPSARPSASVAPPTPLSSASSTPDPASPLARFVAAAARPPLAIDAAPKLSASDEAALKNEGSASSFALGPGGAVFVATHQGHVFERTPKGWEARGDASNLAAAPDGRIWGVHGWVGIHEGDQGRVYRYDAARHAFDAVDVVKDVVPLAIAASATPMPIVLPKSGARLFAVAQDATSFHLVPQGVPFTSSATHIDAAAMAGNNVAIAGLSSDEQAGQQSATLWTSADAGASWMRHTLPARGEAATCTAELCAVIVERGALFEWPKGAKVLRSAGVVTPTSPQWSGFRARSLALLGGRLVVAGSDSGNGIVFDVTEAGARVRQGIGDQVVVDGAGTLWLTGSALHRLDASGPHEVWPSDRDAR